MFSRNVQQFAIASWPPAGITPPAAREARGRCRGWRRGLGGLTLGVLAAWALGGCFAAPTPHPEDDATFAGGGPNDMRDVSVDAGHGDWENTAQPSGDADALYGGDGGLEDQDVMAMGVDADGLLDGAEPAPDALADGDEASSVDVEGADVQGADVGPADTGAEDAVSADSAGVEEEDEGA